MKADVEITETIIHMLGYLTEEQWRDAFNNHDHLDVEQLNELREAVCKRYDMTIEVAE